MDEKKNECRAYRVTVTTLKPVDKETGKRPEGRDVILDAYAYSGNLPEDYVDFGSYWDEDDNGYVELRTGDGREVSDLNRIMEYVNDNGFMHLEIPRPEDLGADRRWFEFPLPGAADGRLLRVELLDGLPKLDADRTRADSELTIMAQHRVKIGGVPLFRDGDVHTPCGEVLRTDLDDGINEMWRERIRERGGVDVAVKVYAEPDGRNFVITAKSREDLRAALGALLVGQPEKIAPSVEYGTGDHVVAVVAKVAVKTRIAG